MVSPMTALIKQLSTYATYHRDQRNIATHFFGVPMIFVAVVALLSRPLVELGGFFFAPIHVVGLLAAIFYLRLEVRFGLVMLANIIAAAIFGRFLAAQSTAVWLGVSIGLFVVGWVIQFIGHYYEGKKPAFVDDLVGLLVGPAFVTAELGFKLGLRKDLEREIEAIAGPTYVRDLKAPKAAS